MNNKIREHLVKYNLKNEYGTSDADLFETLFEAEELYSKQKTKHRWWIDIFTVVEIDGMFIGFMYAETTGDNNPKDVGWEFDPRSICEVVPKEVKSIIYEKV